MSMLVDVCGLTVNVMPWVIGGAAALGAIGAWNQAKRSNKIAEEEKKAKERAEGELRNARLRAEAPFINAITPFVNWDLRALGIGHSGVGYTIGLINSGMECRHVTFSMNDQHLKLLDQAPHPLDNIGDPPNCMRLIMCCEKGGVHNEIEFEFEVGFECIATGFIGKHKYSITYDNYNKKHIVRRIIP